MFKQLKQDKKSLKVFKDNCKSIHNRCECEINGKVEEMDEHLAIYATKKKPKKKMPKNEDVFGKTPSKNKPSKK
jgi:hypothetical protein